MTRLFRSIFLLKVCISHILIQKLLSILFNGASWISTQLAFSRVLLNKWHYSKVRKLMGYDPLEVRLHTVKPLSSPRLLEGYKNLFIIVITSYLVEGLLYMKFDWVVLFEVVSLMISIVLIKVKIGWLTQILFLLRCIMQTLLIAIFVWFTNLTLELIIFKFSLYTSNALFIIVVCRFTFGS